MLYLTCACLSEDEPTGSKHVHVEDIMKIKLNLVLKKLHFVGLHFMEINAVTLSVSATMSLLKYNNKLHVLTPSDHLQVSSVIKNEKEKHSLPHYFWISGFYCICRYCEVIYILYFKLRT